MRLSRSGSGLLSHASRAVLVRFTVEFTVTEIHHRDAESAEKDKPLRSLRLGGD